MSTEASNLNHIVEGLRSLGAFSSEVRRACARLGQRFAESPGDVLQSIAHATARGDVGALQQIAATLDILMDESQVLEASPGLSALLARDNQQTSPQAVQELITHMYAQLEARPDLVANDADWEAGLAAFG
jgi:hypothetical protein